MITGNGNLATTLFIKKNWNVFVIGTYISIEIFLRHFLNLVFKDFDNFWDICSNFDIFRDIFLYFGYFCKLYMIVWDVFKTVSMYILSKSERQNSLYKLQEARRQAIFLVVQGRTDTMVIREQLITSYAEKLHYTIRGADLELF